MHRMQHHVTPDNEGEKKKKKTHEMGKGGEKKTVNTSVVQLSRSRLWESEFRREFLFFYFSSFSTGEI